MKRKVLLYETESGKCFVKDFIQSLPVKIQREIVKILKLLEEVEMLTEPYFKKLKDTDDIWEARKRFGSNSYRILFFFDEEYEQLKIGYMLRQARKKSGITQEKLAKLMNTYKGNISRIENHAEDIKLSTLSKFVESLGKKLVISIE